jgi:hypothetical protein
VARRAVGQRWVRRLLADWSRGSTHAGIGSSWGDHGPAPGKKNRARPMKNSVFS